MTKLISIHIDGKVYLRPKNMLSKIHNTQAYWNFEQSVQPILCLFQINEGQEIEEGEVELVWQYLLNKEWCDCYDTSVLFFMNKGYETRQAYRLKTPAQQNGSDVERAGESKNKFAVEYATVDGDFVQHIYDAVMFGYNQSYQRVKELQHELEKYKTLYEELDANVEPMRDRIILLEAELLQTKNQ